MEDWSEIRGFPKHLVSDHGRVANWETGTVLKPRPSGWGYLQVMLWSSSRAHTKTVHRLVAEAFVPGFDHGLDVNHIDGDKLNNHDWNLEWVTRGDNNRHALALGLRKPRGTPVKVLETGMVFSSVKECADYLGVHSSGISAVLNRKAPRYKGWTFAYA